MKTLYLDLGMGAAGDMLTAALLELLPDEEQESFIAEMNSLGIPGVEISREIVMKSGISGSQMRVLIHGVEEGEEHGHEGHEHGHHVHGHEEEHEHGHHGHGHEEEHEHVHHGHGHEEEHEHGHHGHGHEEKHGHGHHKHGHHGHGHEGEQGHHQHTHEECRINNHDEIHEYYDHDHKHDHEHDHKHDHGHGHDHHHGHHHTSMRDIEELVYGLAIEEDVKKDVMAVYNLIAEAESHAHGRPVTEIHFHEVGMMDAIADVTAVCLLMHRLSPERVIASPVHVGSGHVQCAHGIMPVPAPATAYILRDVPIYGGSIKGELCTPTGAALIKYFADSFGDMPVMTTEAIGYGMGKKEFSQMNCVRALLGEEWKSGKVQDKNAEPDKGDEIIELICNVDDMTGEEIGFAVNRLFTFGAREVFTVAVQMKKARPGVMLHVLTDTEKKDEMVRRIFALTSTIGIRVVPAERYILERREESVKTSLGTVRRKICSGYGVERYKWEYDDVEAIAREQNMSVREVREILDMDETQN